MLLVGLGELEGGWGPQVWPSALLYPLLHSSVPLAWSSEGSREHLRRQHNTVIKNLGLDSGKWTVRPSSAARL